MVTAAVAGLQTVPVPASEQLHVCAGDVLGVATPTPLLCHTSEGSMAVGQQDADVSQVAVILKSLSIISVSYLFLGLYRFCHVTTVLFDHCGGLFYHHFLFIFCNRFDRTGCYMPLLQQQIPGSR